MLELLKHLKNRFRDQGGQKGSPGLPRAPGGWAIVLTFSIVFGYSWGPLSIVVVPSGENTNTTTLKLCAACLTESYVSLRDEQLT